MRTLATLASVVVLAASSVGCDSSAQGSNSSNDLLPLASVVSPTMLQARGGNGGGNGNRGGNENQNSAPTSSLTPMMVNDVGASGFSAGDTISFNVSTSATDAHVTLNCYQDGSVVLSAWTPYVASSAPQWTLSTPSWQAGAAHCTAELIYFSGSKDVVLASSNFDVAG